MGKFGRPVSWVAVVVVLVLLLSAGVVGSVGPGSSAARTEAAFTDGVTGEGGSVGTGALPASLLTGEPAEGLAAALSWEAASDQGATPNYTLMRTGPGQEDPTEVYSGTEAGFTDPGNLPRELIEENITQVSAGWAFSLALSEDGTIWGWGYNGEGQIGLSPEQRAVLRPVEVSLPGQRRASSIVAGGFHALAIATDGTLWAWGMNRSGQIGDGSTTSSAVPVQVSLPGGRVPGSIGAGYEHSLAVATDGTFWAWGSNGSGRLGDNSTVPSSSVPVAVSLPEGRTVTTAKAGREHSIALADDGTLWAWGRNNFGQLGSDRRADSAVPLQVVLPGGRSATEISSGYNHNLAIASDGTGWAWGGNAAGQIGNGTETNVITPVAINLPGNRGFSAVAAGGYHSLAVASDGSVWVWGNNGNGQLGTGGSARNVTSPTSLSLPGAGLIYGVATGGYHTLVLSVQDSVWSWGHNSLGQLGDGTVVPARTPAMIPSFTSGLCPIGSSPLPDSELCSLIQGGEYSYTLTTTIGGWSSISEPVTVSPRE